MLVEAIRRPIHRAEAARAEQVTGTPGLDEWLLSPIRFSHPGIGQKSGMVEVLSNW